MASRVTPQHLQLEAQVLVRWEGGFRLDVHATDGCPTQVYAKHTASNTFLGQVEIPLDPLMAGDILEDWFPLQMRRQGEEVAVLACATRCLTLHRRPGPRRGKECCGVQRQTNKQRANKPTHRQALTQADPSRCCSR